MILKIGYKLEDIDFIKEEAKYYFEKVFDVQVEECEWEAADLKLAIEKNDADLDQIHIELEKEKRYHYLKQQSWNFDCTV